MAEQEGQTVIEIARFDGNEAYRQNPHIIDEAFKIVEQTEGCHAIWHGLQEEKNRVWLVLWWESVPAHYALVNNEPVYKNLGKLFAKCGSDEHHMLHNRFTSNPVAHFQAPVTEVTWLKPKVASDEIEQHLKQGHGFSWGETVETPVSYVLVTGAQKVEAHNLSQNEAVKQIQGHFEDVEVCHIKLYNFKKPPVPT